MLQFTEGEISHIKKKAKTFPKALEQLKKDVQEVLEQPVLVPKTGIGNWYHYYFCPDCSVKLVFDRWGFCIWLQESKTMPAGPLP